MVKHCEYCEKKLSEDKGEIAHGCLDCANYPWYTDKIDIRNDIIIRLFERFDNDDLERVFDLKHKDILMDIID